MMPTYSLMEVIKLLRLCDNMADLTRLRDVIDADKHLYDIEELETLMTLLIGRRWQLVTGG
jgi:hypothetical protein